MYILLNALLNVWRNRGRNALLGAAVLFVIATSVVAMMISSTASSIIDDYRGRFSTEVQFRPNMEKVREDAMANSTNGLVLMTPPTIDPDEYIAFGESEHLADARYTADTGVVPEGLTVVDEELGGGTGMTMMGGPGADPDAEAPMEYFASLHGGKLTEFEEGTRALAGGEFPDEVGEVLVSSDLAELNDLELGDTFTAAGQLREPGEEQGEFALHPISYDLTVVGIYDDLTEPYGTAPVQNAYTNTRNEILTTYETVLQGYSAGLTGIRIEATFYLSDPSHLAAFTDEVRAKGLSDLFDVTTDTASYEQIVGPVEGLKSVALTFMVVVLALGGTIIALLSSMAIRERRYEIGVLRAMGMKKSLVALGLWMESLIITGACLVAGLGIGALVAQPVTDRLLEGQVATAEAAAAERAAGGPGMGMGGGMFGGAAPDAEPLRELAVSLSPSAMGQTALVALLVATLAGLIALSRITKYEPMRILSERS